MMKIINTLYALVIMVLLNTYPNVYAKALSVNNVISILNETSLIADDFNLTTLQKHQVRLVLLNYLPVMALKVNEMINNRIELIESSLTNDSVDEDMIVEIAVNQGQLLSDLIIAKEHMKKDLRGILKNDQKEYINNLFETIILYKLEHRELSSVNPFK